MNGEVLSNSFCLSGHFEGTCRTKRMEILAGGVFKGSLYTDELVIKEGGHFLGNSFASDVVNEISPSVSSLELIPEKIVKMAKKAKS